MLKPVNDYILVSYEEKEKTAGGIIMLPASTDERVRVVEVLAMSDTFSIADIKVGSKISVDGYSMTVIEDPETKIKNFLVESKSIYAIVR